MPSAIVIDSVVHLEHPERSYTTFCNEKFQGPEIEYQKGDYNTSMDEATKELKNRGRICRECKDKAREWSERVYR